MNERDFVRNKRADWEELTALVEKANGRGGVRSLSSAELRRFGPLYRRIASDLACARAHSESEDLVLHLNSLVGRAHALLYGSAVGGNAFRAVVAFYLFEFPALLQRHIRPFLLALGITIGGGVIAYWLCITQPQKLDLFIPPQFQSSLERWKQGDLADEAHAEFSAQLFVNNFNVGLIASASGIAGGIPTCFTLFSNGTTLGAFAAVMTQYKRHSTFWPGILPHGIAELTAIFICGGAGLLLGSALLFPGRQTRRDAFRLRGTDAIRLVLGSLPLFIFAGIIEGMFSHLAIPSPMRYTFAAANGMVWYLYLFLPRPQNGAPVSVLDKSFQTGQAFSPAFPLTDSEKSGEARTG